MNKKVLLSLAGAGAAVGAAAAAVPYMIFNSVFGRPKRSTKVPSFYVGTPHYNVSQAGLKVMKSIKYEDKYLMSRDGLKLHAYLFPAKEKSNKFLLGIHGYCSYSRPEYAPFFEFYRNLGYNIFLPDDRAHAPSEGKYIGFGVLDRLDCVDWAKYIVKNYGEDCEILLHGVSMGGATVLAASGEKDLPIQVKGITADCGYTSAYDILAYQAKNMHLPANLILPKVEKICEEKAGFNFHDYSALEQVKQAKVPILFVHGEKDPLVPPAMVHELYDACSSEKKRIMTVPEAAHGESIAFAPEEYHKNIKELFNL